MLRDTWGELVDAAADLLLGGCCAGCLRPGRVLCPTCARELPTGGRPAWPDPVPAGLVPPWAAAEYDGVVRALVIGHKERRLLGLRGPLAGLLHQAVRAALASSEAGPVVLVPVPSRPGVVRARGHDPMGRVTARTARLLRHDGYDVTAMQLLRCRPGAVDQAGLGASARAANLAGSMHCPTELLRRLAARRTHARIVVCDDVVTTGATLRETQRALEAVGLEVAAVAAVAATRRRRPTGGARGLSSSDPTD
ncbi:ComF family protein [Nocardioides sp. URHA0020]|uniref:ComF family protein n=1 Tax=Nocardioides sp. URHA0020 TaxID=1380392 RepID=UPI00048BFBDD|nr:phosphoribosyltransferase family protein [Nocardioides sp. URHA0020]